MVDKTIFPKCDQCGDVGCKLRSPGKFPRCPTNVSEHTLDEIKQRYQDEDINKIMQAGAETERGTLRMIDGVMTPIRPRIAEIMAFANSMGWHKLGVAFCLATRDEAIRLIRVLEENDFEVHSIICRAFAMTKGDVGIPDKNCLMSPLETVCNPVYQAELLNEAETDLNIVVGLCVGHDMLFNKYSKAYTTTLMVKDRMTANNPIAPLYSTFFKGILSKKK